MADPLVTEPCIRWYKVPVDDEWHDIELRGAIVHAAARYADADVVEVWAWWWPFSDGERTRRFRVYGTGQPIDVPAVHVRTAITPDGRHVWHLLETRP